MTNKTIKGVYLGDKVLGKLIGFHGKTKDGVTKAIAEALEGYHTDEHKGIEVDIIIHKRVSSTEYVKGKSRSSGNTLSSTDKKEWEEFQRFKRFRDME